MALAPAVVSAIAAPDADASFLGTLLDVLSGRAGYNTQVVVLTATLLGVAAGVIGAFAMLRRQALVSDAMAHATLPGVVGAFLLAVELGAGGRSLPVLLLGAATTAAVGAVCIKAIMRTRLGEDVAIGAVLSVFFGLGIVLLSVAQTEEQASTWKRATADGLGGDEKCADQHGSRGQRRREACGQ